MFDRVVYSSTADKETVGRDTDLNAIHLVFGTIRESAEYRGGGLRRTVGGILDFIKQQQAEMRRIERELKRLARQGGSSTTSKVGKGVLNTGKMVANPVTGGMSLIPSDKVAKATEVVSLASDSVKVAGMVHPIAMPLGAKLVLSPTPALMGLAGASAYTPLTYALAPWLSALTVSLMAGKNMSLKDIRERPTGSWNRWYCKCGRCNEGLDFIIDRSDWKVASVGLCAGIIPAPFVGGGYLVRKLYHKAQGSQSKKHRVAQQLYDSASGRLQWRVRQIPTSLPDSRPYRVLSFIDAGCPRAISILCALMNPLKTAAVMTADAADAVLVIKKTID